MTIFVFTVSQVGRATESASKEQQDILLKQKQAKAKQIEKIQERLEEAKKVGHLDETKLLKELENTKEEIAGYDTELRRLQERILLIRRKGAVVWPGAFFLGALVLTITASGLAEGQNLIALLLWIISIGALVFGGFRVFRTLGAIEEVTITSKEAAEKLPEAVKLALRELEEEKKPRLALVFGGREPPFYIGSSEELAVEVELLLTQGDIVKKPEIALFAPPGFDFPGRKTWLQPERKATVGGHITCVFEYEGLGTASVIPQKFTIKAPSALGEFTLRYRLSCEGFDSGYEEFKVVVE